MCGTNPYTWYQDHTLSTMFKLKYAYAGIGSRQTPTEVLNEMVKLASALAPTHTLRTGAADGADSAFEQGALAAGGSTEVFLPWAGFNGHPSKLSKVAPEALEMAKAIHPAWDRLSEAARKLHARNCNQVLGASLNEPVRMVICWTPDGCESKEQRRSTTGGTASAIVLAQAWGVPVFNLFNDASRDRLVDMLMKEDGLDVSFLRPRNIQQGLF